MQSPDGAVFPMTGIFHEVKEPGMLVFTSSAQDQNGLELFKSFNSITFARQKGKTKLIAHVSVSDITPEAKPYLDGMEEGWNQTLDRLEEFAKNHSAEQSLASKISMIWKRWTPYFQSILRIIASLMFMMAGSVKLFAFPAGMPPDGGTAPFLTQIWIGSVLEFFGGALILIGLFTRPAAFILAGEMAVAYFQFHFPNNYWPVLNQGIPALLYCFVWLYFSSSGAGPWSLDAKKSKKLRTKK